MADFHSVAGCRFLLRGSGHFINQRYRGNEPRDQSHGQVVIANHNGPRQTVVAGPTEAIDALVADLRTARVTARRLPVACAFHSPLVAAARETLAGVLADAAIESPRVPVWSNTTAGPR